MTALPAGHRWDQGYEAIVSGELLSSLLQLLLRMQRLWLSSGNC